jgi:hypothetical protein
MGGSSEKSADWIGLVGALAWPIVGSIALIAFYNPIHASLDRVAKGEAEEVSLGPINVRYSAAKIAEFQHPSEEVGAVLSNLSSFDREILISIGAYSPHADSCTIEGFEQAMLSGTEESNQFFAERIDKIEPYRQYIGAHRRLAALKLVSLDERENLNEPFCQPGAGRTARLTSLGSETRAYYLALVDTALTIPKPASSN